MSKIFKTTILTLTLIININCAYTNLGKYALDPDIDPVKILDSCTWNLLESMRDLVRTDGEIYEIRKSNFTNAMKRLEGKNFDINSKYKNNICKLNLYNIIYESIHEDNRIIICRKMLIELFEKFEGKLDIKINGEIFWTICHNISSDAKQKIENKLLFKLLKFFIPKHKLYRYFSKKIYNMSRNNNILKLMETILSHSDFENCELRNFDLPKLEGIVPPALENGIKNLVAKEYETILNDFYKVSNNGTKKSFKDYSLSQLTLFNYLKAFIGNKRAEKIEHPILLVEKDRIKNNLEEPLYKVFIRLKNVILDKNNVDIDFMDIINENFDINATLEVPVINQFMKTSIDFPPLSLKYIIKHAMSNNSNINSLSNLTKALERLFALKKDLKINKETLNHILNFINNSSKNNLEDKQNQILALMKTIISHCDLGDYKLQELADTVPLTLKFDIEDLVANKYETFVMDGIREEKANGVVEKKFIKFYESDAFKNLKVFIGEGKAIEKLHTIIYFEKFGKL